PHTAAAHPAEAALAARVVADVARRGARLAVLGDAAGGRTGAAGRAVQRAVAGPLEDRLAAVRLAVGVGRHLALLRPVRPDLVIEAVAAEGRGAGAVRH